MAGTSVPSELLTGSGAARQWQSGLAEANAAAPAISFAAEDAAA